MTAPAADPGWRRDAWRAALDYLGMALVLAGLLTFFGLKSEYFLTKDTFLAVAGQIPAITILAVGMTFILVLGEIDLAVGSIAGLSGAALGVCMAGDSFRAWAGGSLSLWPAVGVGLLIGALCGVLSGLLIIRWRLPSFIVTLGLLEMARGGAYLVTDSQTQYIGARVAVLAEPSPLGLEWPFVLALLAVLLGQGLLSKTVFGRYMLAIGANAQAVRYAGIDPRPVRVGVFALSGLLAAAAGILNTAQMQSADPNAGSGWELRAIAAVVVGGTSLMGGRGSVFKSFLGVLIIAVLETGLTQLAVKEPAKRLVTGGVIIAAVIVDHYRGKWGGRSAPAKA